MVKTVEIVFVLISYAVLSALILASATPGSSIDIPTLNIPDLDVNFPGGCSGGIFGIPECIAFLAKAILAIARAVVWAALLIFNLMLFVGQLFLLMGTLAITGIPGAPGLVNVIFFQVPIATMLGMLIYRLVRSGESSD